MKCLRSWLGRRSDRFDHLLVGTPEHFGIYRLPYPVVFSVLLEAILDILFVRQVVVLMARRY